jgi:hypothetical protein
MDSYNNPYAKQNTDRNVFDNMRGSNMNGAMMVQGVPQLANTNIKTQRVNNIDTLVENERNMRFKLKGNDEKFTYQPEKKEFTFYQFCRMHNPERSARNKGRKVHEMRKLIYDEEYRVISRKEALISKDKLQKFIDNAPDHKYTLYETYEIESVDLPSDLEVYTANSNILNGDSFLPAFQESECGFRYDGENRKKDYFLDK